MERVSCLDQEWAMRVEARNKALDLHRKKVLNVAFALGERRELRAQEDHYTQQMYATLDPQQINDNNYFLAESLVNARDNRGLRSLGRDLLRLRARYHVTEEVTPPHPEQ